MKIYFALLFVVTIGCLIIFSLIDKEIDHAILYGLLLLNLERLGAHKLRHINPFK